MPPEGGEGDVGWGDSIALSFFHMVGVDLRESNHAPHLTIKL